MLGNRNMLPASTKMALTCLFFHFKTTHQMQMKDNSTLFQLCDLSDKSNTYNAQKQQNFIGKTIFFSFQCFLHTIQLPISA